jgi:hypothetical protein
MPYHFDYDPKYRLLRTWFEGEVTDDELVEFYKKAGENVALTDPLCGLTDFSACTRFEVTADTIRRLAKLTPALPQPSRPRVIVAPTDRMFGMARIFEIEGETTRPNIHVVRTLQEALLILGVFEQPRYEPVALHRINNQEESDDQEKSPISA